MIKKEVTPNPNTPATPTPGTSKTAPNTPVATKNPNPKATPKKVNYQYAGKENIGEVVRKTIPKQLIPTKRIGAIFGGVFILVLIIAAFQFPLGALMSGQTEVEISVGYPIPFLNLSETEGSPTNPVYLILDLLIYLVLAYAIDITINLIVKNPLVRSKKEAVKRPTVFKNKKKTIVEKAVEKVAIEKQLK